MLEAQKKLPAPPADQHAELLAPFDPRPPPPRPRGHFLGRPTEPVCFDHHAAWDKTTVKTAPDRREPQPRGPGPLLAGTTGTTAPRDGRLDRVAWSNATGTTTAAGTLSLAAKGLRAPSGPTPSRACSCASSPARTPAWHGGRVEQHDHAHGRRLPERDASGVAYDDRDGASPTTWCSAAARLVHLRQRGLHVVPGPATPTPTPPPTTTVPVRRRHPPATNRNATASGSATTGSATALTDGTKA